MSESVFASARSKVFTAYEARIKFREKVLGSTPTNPKVIEAWIRHQAQIEREDEVRSIMLRTLMELGAEVDTDMSMEQLEAASAKVAAQGAVGFKRDKQGIFLEDRHLKAALKETTNILFAGEKWGVTKKGPKNYVAERIFLGPSRLHLERDGKSLPEPDGMELFIGHPSGAGGPRSTLTYYEYAEQAEFSAYFMCVSKGDYDKHWEELWVHMEENGMGALRSQSYGRYDVIAWSQVSLDRVKDLVTQVHRNEPPPGLPVEDLPIDEEREN